MESFDQMMRIDGDKRRPCSNMASLFTRNYRYVAKEMGLEWIYMAEISQQMCLKNCSSRSNVWVTLCGALEPMESFTISRFNMRGGDFY